MDGTTDIQIATTDGDLLMKARPAAKRVTLDGMNHVLRELPSTNRTIQMLNYQNDLISMTQGRASYSMEFDHYDFVPGQQADKIIAAAKAALDKAR